MSVASIAARYKSVQVQTGTPGQLLVLLFDGALRFTAEAQKAMEEKNRARAGERIGKALAILEELAASLDKSHAPELGENLEALYVFCMHELVRANIEQDPARIAAVADILRPVREGFAEIAQAPRPVP